jgi:cellulose synthase/poly-beta-1,6-N-acetylglucosamine synthase-like glycosyltransferase
LNRESSALTRAQALLLDAHFVIEQGARHGAGLYFNFNGTAGVWRRAAILEAGGWHHDTLTEDMDLSYRALLAGWRFVYLSDVVAPAELPAEMNAWKGQQFRWAKGSIQVAKKILPAIARAEVPRRVKREALLHLTANLSYPLMLILCLLLVPAVLTRAATPAIDLPFCALALVSLATYYVASQRAIAGARPGGARAAIARLPLLMAVGCGLCVNQARAVGEALFGKPSEFVRTPKQGSARVAKYRGARTWVPVIELGLAIYLAAGAALAVRGGQWLALPFLVLFAIGFAYVGVFSLARR